MTERTALLLVLAASSVATCVGVLGLHALGANEATVGLGFLVPLCAGAYGMSCVVMHYDSSDRDRR
jgi:hypothetical protein